MQFPHSLKTHAQRKTVTYTALAGSQSSLLGSPHCWWLCSCSSLSPPHGSSRWWGCLLAQGCWEALGQESGTKPLLAVGHHLSESTALWCCHQGWPPESHWQRASEQVGLEKHKEGHFRAWERSIHLSVHSFILFMICSCWWLVWVETAGKIYELITNMRCLWI